MTPSVPHKNLCQPAKKRKSERERERESRSAQNVNSKTLKILLSLFTINSISHYIYFSHSDHHQSRQTTTCYRNIPHPNTSPFPSNPGLLPSYFSWSQISNVPIRSCETYSHQKIFPPAPPPPPGGLGNSDDSGEKISMSNGGEKLESVIGRGEDKELPSFEDGAFEIGLVDQEFLEKYVQEGAVQKHTMRGLIDSIRLVDAIEFSCSEVNWYSAYVNSRVTGLPNRPHLVFVDGHFCFCHAILAPLGYDTALFKGLYENMNCHGASAHDLWQKPDDQKTTLFSKPASGHNILFVLSNEQEVIDSIMSWTSNHPDCKFNVVNELFAHAAVIIGAHRAGLTHIVSATPKTVVINNLSSILRSLGC
ncbi:hypothetical protein Pfo_013516 [Paulownia fortunei]|nr:hypothetical protein Pfo_013516 [Paulownia fortunei]